MVFNPMRLGSHDPEVLGDKEIGQVDSYKFFYFFFLREI